MRFLKLATYKAYFDKGFSFLNYLKYPLFLIGMGDVLSSGGDWRNVAIAAVIIAILCFVVGKAAYYYRWVDAEHEVQNRVNPFVREMRNEKFK